MGYIVDVTIVLEILFWLKVHQPRTPHAPVLEGDIDAAVGLYRRSNQHLDVHNEIRKYVDGMTLLDHANPQDNTHLEVERLIYAHRQILIDMTSPIAAQESEQLVPVVLPAPHAGVPVPEGVSEILPSSTTQDGLGEQSSATQSSQRPAGNKSVEVRRSDL